MTIDDKLKEFNETFEFLEGLEKIEYLVDLSKKSKGLAPHQKTEKTKVYGCASETWVIVENSNDRIYIHSDSETQIVKGMLYLLEESFNGHSKKEILQVDEQSVLDRLGLGGSITNRRMNGFASAILKVKDEITKLS